MHILKNIVDKWKLGYTLVSPTLHFCQCMKLWGNISFSWSWHKCPEWNPSQTELSLRRWQPWWYTWWCDHPALVLTIVQEEPVPVSLVNQSGIPWKVTGREIVQTVHSNPFWVTWNLKGKHWLLFKMHEKPTFPAWPFTHFRELNRAYQREPSLFFMHLHTSQIKSAKIKWSLKAGKQQWPFVSKASWKTSGSKALMILESMSKEPIIGGSTQRFWVYFQWSPKLPAKE
jgi:hypothetical protein